MLARRTAPDRTGLGSSDDLERLRKRVAQQERSLAILAQALSAVRSANEALRDENRELRLGLQNSERARHARRRPVLRPQGSR